MKTVDEKRMERIKKLCTKVSKFDAKDFENLPEWRQKEVIEMLKRMESHLLWLHGFFQGSIETTEEQHKEAEGQ